MGLVDEVAPSATALLRSVPSGRAFIEGKKNCRAGTGMRLAARQTGTAESLAEDTRRSRSCWPPRRRTQDEAEDLARRAQVRVPLRDQGASNTATGPGSKRVSTTTPSFSARWRHPPRARSGSAASSTRTRFRRRSQRSWRPDP
ncbi:MAG: hypothetical protein MZV70_28710 [Desulfobacterales bacterium]|nr:hypothetical protein [Desulfobacterales bacterium]